MQPRFASSLVPVLLLAACATRPAPAPALPSHWELPSPGLATIAPVVSPASASPGATDDLVSYAEVDESRSLALSPMLAGGSPQEPLPGGAPRRTSAPVRWRPGEVVLTGFFGAASYDLEGSGGRARLEDADATFPTIGGGAQWKLGGERIDFGLEALLSFGWQSNVSAVVSGSNGLLVAADISMLVFDLYGGPFASVFLGDSVRLYGGAGPLMQWCRYEQNTVTTVDSGDSSGFGLGYYVRAGLEFAVSGNTMIGFAMRWSDVEVDLNDNLGDLQTRGIQYLFTVSQGF